MTIIMIIIIIIFIQLFNSGLITDATLESQCAEAQNFNQVHDVIGGYNCRRACF